MPFIAQSPGLSACSYNIADGREGILQTVFIMRAMVTEFRINPQIRALALSLVEFLPQKDYLDEVDKLFHFVRDEIRYVQDIYEIETLSTPDKTIELGQGDCDDKSVLLATLLETLGFKTAFKITGYHGSAFEHVYVYVTVPNVGSLHLDATEPESMGYEPPNPTVALYVE